MGKETYPDPRVVVLSKEVVFTKINGKEDTVLAKKYGIAGFPTAIVASAKGEEVDRIVGFYPPEEFSATVRDYLAGKNTLVDFEKRAKKKPNDLQLAYRLADKYLGRGKYSSAEALLNRIVEEDRDNKTGKADSAVHYLGEAAYSQKNYSEAISRFTKANEMFPLSPWVEENDIYMAAAYEKAGETQKAIEYYQKYLDKWPEGDDRGYAQEHIDKLKGAPQAEQQH